MEVNKSLRQKKMFHSMKILRVQRIPNLEGLRHYDVPNILNGWEGPEFRHYHGQDYEYWKGASHLKDRVGSPTLR